MFDQDEGRLAKMIMIESESYQERNRQQIGKRWKGGMHKSWTTTRLPERNCASSRTNEAEQKTGATVVKSEKKGADGKMNKEQVEQGAKDILS